MSCISSGRELRSGRERPRRRRGPVRTSVAYNGPALYRCSRGRISITGRNRVLRDLFSLSLHIALCRRVRGPCDPTIQPNHPRPTNQRQQANWTRARSLLQKSAVLKHNPKKDNHADSSSQAWCKFLSKIFVLYSGNWRLPDDESSLNFVK